jgi:hypothetical protein
VNKPARETSCHLAPSGKIPVGLVIMFAQASSMMHVNPAKPIPSTPRFNVVNMAFYNEQMLAKDI